VRSTCVVALCALFLTWRLFGQVGLHPPPSGGSCGSGAGWDFEDGSLQGWTPSGTAFQQQPLQGDISVVRVQPAGFRAEIASDIGGNYWSGYGWPNGHGGDFWIGSRDYSTGTPVPVDRGDASTGVLTSPVFIVGSNFVSFLMGGGRTTQERVELQILARDAAEALALARAPVTYTESPAPPGPAFVRQDGLWVTMFAGVSRQVGEVLERQAFLVTAYRGRTARVRVVDESSIAHINADDFTCADRVPPPPDPIPLWGFADLHSHPRSDLGFGGLFWGKPTGPIESLLSCPGPTHGGHLVLTGALGGIVQGVTGSQNASALVVDQMLEMNRSSNDIHDKQGFPSFKGWPYYDTAIHQQMHVDWIKRAWQGGLRVLFADVVNNRLLALGMGAEQLDDDAFQQEIAGIRELVQSQPWMQIANTPAQARQIIQQGRLAVVLGVELDQLELLLKSQLQKNKPRNEATACAVGMVGSVVAPLAAGGAAGIAGAGAIPVEAGATAALAPLLPGIAELVGITATSTTAVATVSAITASATASLAAAALAPSASQVCPYANRDVYTLPPGVNLQTFTRQLVDKLVQNGVRHVIPIHLVNNSFGGTAVYMDALNLLNFYENDKWFEGATPSGSAGDVDRVISSVALPPGCSGALCVTLQSYPQAAQVNRIGLTAAGAQLIAELEHRGMILDVSHMSDRSLNDTLHIVAPGCTAPGSPACAGGYPVMSSHTGVRETEHAPVALSAQGTFRTERDLGRPEAQMIRDMGGMVGMGVAPTTVPSDCMGSTRSFGVEFGELLNDMRPAALRSHPLGVGPASTAELAQVRGVALGTDGNGMNGMTIPRFGDFACGRRPSYVVVAGPNTPPFSGVGAPQAYALAYRSSGPIFGSSCSVPPTVPRMTGEAALVQSVAGERRFDYNCDGLAHYGMLPDFLQDTRNAAVGAGAFRPLMRSAEDMIEMWEKSCRLAESVGGGDACQ